MKWFSRFILLLMLAGGAWLLAFGPRPQQKFPAGRTIVTYWDKWSGPEAESMQSIVDDFNNTVGVKKNIYVDYVSLANVQYKTLSATAAGVPPDIAGVWPAQVVQYALHHAAEPLDELAAEHGIRADDYKPVFWDICTYQHHLFALPTTPAVIALHYNKLYFYKAAKKLRALGLDPTRPPKTLQEFDRYAQALDVYFPGTHRLKRAGYFTMDSGWYITATNIWFGGRWWDPKAQIYTLLTPPNIASFQWIASYSKRMGESAFTDFQSGLGAFSSPNNPFISGAVAMVQQGPWMANYIRAYGPDFSQVIVPFQLEPFLPRVLRLFNYGWGVAAFPSAVPGLNDVSYCETDVLMIPRGAAHRREAFEFMAFTQRQDEMEKLCRATCKNSPLKRTSDNWIYSHPNPYVDVFDHLAASPNAVAPDKTPIYNEAGTELSVAAQQTYLLQETPRQALSGVQQRIDKLLQRYKEHAALAKE